VLELLFLLLPLAAASGWWIARRDAATHPGEPLSAAPALFRGLNYLLNEQPNKAIDVLVKLAEVDGEVAEIHLALGGLFRRRGEVDRAILIHQNLIARDNLNREQRGLALFELAQDYMAAGLLDRAELLFQEVIEHDVNREQALRGLSDIYQQERDWLQCLEVAERLKPLTDRPMGVEIAHYHCELAEEARRSGDTTKAHKHLSRAQQADPGGARATIIEGQMALAAGTPQRALDLFLRVADQGPPFLPEILPELVQSLDSLGQDEIPVLESLAARHPSPPLMLGLAKAIERERGAEAAIETLTGYLAGHVDLAALERLLALQCAGTPAEAGRGDCGHVVHRVVRHLLARQPSYQCNHCGFQARALHWQCPSCKRWGSVHPVQPECIPSSEALKGPRTL
jgi:lipopolysaccharide biosynthesis regulator YciM